MAWNYVLPSPWIDPPGESGGVLHENVVVDNHEDNDGNDDGGEERMKHLVHHVELQIHNILLQDLACSEWLIIKTKFATKCVIPTDVISNILWRLSITPKKMDGKTCDITNLERPILAVLEEYRWAKQTAFTASFWKHIKSFMLIYLLDISQRQCLWSGRCWY